MTSYEYCNLYANYDTVRFTMRQAGITPLLTRDEEQELGRRKEECTITLAERVLRSPYAKVVLDQTKKDIQIGRMSWVRVFSREGKDDEDNNKDETLEEETAAEQNFAREKSLFQQFYSPNGDLQNLLKEINYSWWTTFVAQTLDPVKYYCKLIEMQRAMDQSLDSLDQEKQNEYHRTKEVIRNLEQQLGSFSLESKQFLTAIHSDQLELKQIEDRVMNANIKLVVSIAKGYRGRGLDFADLIQEGNLGVYKAWQKFDYSKGYKFSSIATTWIRNSIKKAVITKSRAIKIPDHLEGLIHTIQAKSIMFYERKGYAPSVEELAELMKLPIIKVKDVLYAIKAEPTFLEDLTKENEDGDKRDWQDLFPDDSQSTIEENYMHSIDIRAVTTAISRLDPKQEKVIRMRFGIPLSPDSPLQQHNPNSEEVLAKLRAIEARAYRRVYKSR